MMRIITGSARGVRLLTLPGDATRPTAEKTKEAVFSAIQFLLEGRRVLDLFAGSGQMGLEALSRGAESCMFIDASREAMEIVKQNAQKTRLSDRSRMLVSDYRTYIGKAKTAFDLVFIDPPYAMQAVGDAVLRLHEKDCLANGAILVCESGEEDPFGGALPDCFCIEKQARYGISHIHILRYTKVGEDKAEWHAYCSREASTQLRKGMRTSLHGFRVFSPRWWSPSFKTRKSRIFSRPRIVPLCFRRLPPHILT